VTVSSAREHDFSGYRHAAGDKSSEEGALSFLAQSRTLRRFSLLIRV
jgi:hypothetical protein